MPGRKADAIKHPALVDHLRRERLEMSDTEIEELQGWMSLTPDMRRFIALLPVHSTMLATQKAMGLPHSWAYNLMARHPIFKWAIESRPFTGTKLAKLMVETEIPYSIDTLIEMIHDESTTERLRLDAIKHLHKIQGLGEMGPTVATQINFIDTQSIGSIAKNRRRRRPKVIEHVEGGDNRVAR